jgi:predicted nuclease with TOPRIM domain
MRAKKIGYFLSVLLLFSAFMCTVGAVPDTTVTFRGVGVTIDLKFPEEASPMDNIFHNLTITAYNYVNSLNITLFIYAPIDSTWQIIDPPHNIPWSFPLGVNQSLPTAEINFTLPQNANGLLKCTLYVQTNQTTDYPFYTFYTTHVSEPTFSEMQILYNEMLANYTALQANYTTLLNEYDGLLANYSSLFANYTTLLSQYNQLSTEYNAKVAAYQASLDNYNTLSGEYDALDSNYRSKVNEFNALQSNYKDLNSTHNSLQTNYTRLEADYSDLNDTYIGLLGDLNSLQVSFSDSQSAVNNDRIVMFIFMITLVALIAFIIYLKRGKEEPYVVIRKETVSMNQDENPDQSNQT